MKLAEILDFHWGLIAKDKIIRPILQMTVLHQLQFKKVRLIIFFHQIYSRINNKHLVVSPIKNLLQFHRLMQIWINLMQTNHKISLIQLILHQLWENWNQIIHYSTSNNHNNFNSSYNSKVLNNHNNIRNLLLNSTYKKDMELQLNQLHNHLVFLLTNFSLSTIQSNKHLKYWGKTNNLFH